MSSKASTTIGFERRFNHALTIADEDGRSSTSPPGGSQLRPPNMERIVALNRGPFVGAPQALERLTERRRRDDRRRARRRRVLVRARARRDQHSGRRIVVLDEERVPASSPARRSSSTPQRTTRSSAPRAGCAPSRCWTSRATCSDPPHDERLDADRARRGRELLAAGEIEVLDVREKDERDGGYIAGTRNIPYRLLRVWASARREAGRHDLQHGRARGDRGERARRAAGSTRAPRPARRRSHAGGARRPHGRAPPLRKLEGTEDSPRRSRPADLSCHCSLQHVARSYQHDLAAGAAWTARGAPVGPFCRGGMRRIPARGRSGVRRRPAAQLLSPAARHPARADGHGRTRGASEVRLRLGAAPADASCPAARSRA